MKNTGVLPDKKYSPLLQYTKIIKRFFAPLYCPIYVISQQIAAGE
jgi:hypothetical protein